MSASITITCDDCGAIGPNPRKTHRTSRRALRVIGWTNRRPGLDQCKACTDKQKAKIPEDCNGYV